ncbi:hypothetical protein [Frigidibacter oleivorans]|uniref:hypothetical protein n=1 Tax=Frigidibacter oleivorans TaxID=2487129 RepID=UPI000F8F1C32|nr:hypothetical protein [Frigidibacter oleivorans]
MSYAPKIDAPVEARVEEVIESLDTVELWRFAVAVRQIRDGRDLEEAMQECVAEIHDYRQHNEARAEGAA